MNSKAAYYAEIFKPYFHRYGQLWSIIGDTIFSGGYAIGSLTNAQFYGWIAFSYKYVKPGKMDIYTGKGVLDIFIEYFITELGKTPADQWCTKVFTNAKGQHCVLGHCAVMSSSVLGTPVRSTPLAGLLSIILPEIVEINDGRGDFAALGDEPKRRVIKALKRAKAGKRVL